VGMMVVCGGRFRWLRGGSRGGLWWLIWMVSRVLVLVFMVDFMVVVVVLVVAHGGFVVVDLNPYLDLNLQLLVAGGCEKDCYVI
jgi:hypothetical protein